MSFWIHLDAVAGLICSSTFVSSVLYPRSLRPSGFSIIKISVLFLFLCSSAEAQGAEWDLSYRGVGEYCFVLKLWCWIWAWFPSIARPNLCFLILLPTAQYIPWARILAWCHKFRPATHFVYTCMIGTRVGEKWTDSVFWTSELCNRPHFGSNTRLYSVTPILSHVAGPRRRKFKHDWISHIFDTAPIYIWLPRCLFVSQLLDDKALYI